MSMMALCPVHGYSCGGDCIRNAIGFDHASNQLIMNDAYANMIKDAQQRLARPSTTSISLAGGITTTGNANSILVSNGSMTNEKKQSKKLLLLLR